MASFYFAWKWFPNGSFFGGADVGIPFYNPVNQLAIVSSSWWQTHGTGMVIPMTFTAVLFYKFFSFLSILGFSPHLLQLIFTFLILAGGSLSIYSLLLTFFPKQKGTAFISGFLYLTNFMSLSVWHRGVPNAMLFLLLMPLSLFILVKWFSKRPLLAIIAFDLVCLLCSYVFGAVGYIITLWISVLGFLTVSFFLTPSKRRKTLFWGTLLIVSWMLTNGWWLFFFLRSSGFELSTFSDAAFASSTVDVLVGLATQTRLEYVLRDLSWFDLYARQDWGMYYFNPIIVLLSWVLPLIVFGSALFSELRANFYWRFFFMLTIIVTFISKGINPPFGQLTAYVYKVVPSLAPLRNPYEKIGILLALCVPIIFGFLYAEVISRSRKLTFSFTIFVCILSIILFWPMWAGKMFSVPEHNYIVNVPDYYNEASKWLSTRTNGSRVLHLPLAPGESVDYDWGYSGGDPTYLLFTGPSLSYTTGQGGTDLRVHDLIRLIHTKDTNAVKKALASLNIEYIVLHNESLGKMRGLEDSKEIGQWLTFSDSFAEKQIEFGPLSIWQVKKEFVTPKVYAANAELVSVSKVARKDDIRDVWETLEHPNSVFINGGDSSLAPLVSLDILYPTGKVFYQDLVLPDPERAKDELKYVRHLPGSILYPWIKFKENLEDYLNPANPVEVCLANSGKRLVETYLLKDSSTESQNLSSYNEVLKSCNELVSTTSRKFVQWEHKDMYERMVSTLINQYSIVNQALSEAEGHDEAEKTLLTFMNMMKVVPRNLRDSNTLTAAYNFDVPSDATYSFLLKPEFSFVNDYNIVSINNKEVKDNLKKDGNTLLSQISLTKGQTEVHLEGINSQISLSSFWKDTETKDVLSLEQDPGVLEYDIPKVSSDYYYSIEFEYFTVRGSPPAFRVIQDVDPVDQYGKVIPRLEKVLSEEDYRHYWKKIGYIYQPSGNAKSAKVLISVEPWNNCERLNLKWACKDQSFRKKFNLISEVQLRSFSIHPVLIADPVLEYKKPDYSKLGNATIKYSQIDNETYQIDVSNQEVPYLLVFSESYHPAWKLVDATGENIEAKHTTVNGYANAWLIESPLSGPTRIRFVLEDAKGVGIMVSLVGTIATLALGVVGFFSFKKFNGKYK